MPQRGFCDVRERAASFGEARQFFVCLAGINFSKALPLAFGVVSCHDQQNISESLTQTKRKS